MNFEKIVYTKVSTNGTMINKPGSIITNGSIIIINGKCNLPNCHCSDGYSLTVSMPRTIKGKVELIKVTFKDRKEMKALLKI